jgi:selenocysteine lyase/cysteine desulfurase
MNELATSGPAAVSSPSAAALEAALPRLRAETPAAAEVVHFNHAGDSPSPRPVLDVVQAHLEREALIGGYEAEDEAAERIENVYAAIGRLLNAKTDEIAIVENATRAWDMVFYAIPFAAGDRILTSVSEYGSNAIAFLQVAERTGARVEVVPNDEHGQLSTGALAEMLDDRVRLVAVSHMPTNGGLVQPAAAIGRLAREAGAFYLLDACQTAGQLPLDVGDLGCDALTATSRKYLRGPRGVGFLYVRRDRLEQLVPPFLDIRAATWVAHAHYEVRPDARRFENWESAVAAKLGLGRAVDYALDLGIDAIWERVERLAATLRRSLAGVPGVSVHDLGLTKGGIVTFTVEGASAANVVAALMADRINTSVSSIASTRYDMEARGLDDVVRASVHYVTTDDEIRRLVDAVAELASAHG